MTDMRWRIITQYRRDFARRVRYSNKKTAGSAKRRRIGFSVAFAVRSRLLHHKSSKEEFQRVFWVTVIVNCAALGWLMSYHG